eukprot:gene23634-9163_t
MHASSRLASGGSSVLSRAFGEVGSIHHLRVVRLRRCSTSPGATKADTNLGWVAPENKLDVAKILDQADRCANRWDITWTDFHTPAVVADAMVALSGRSEVLAVPFGGIALGREEMMGVMKENPTSAMVAAEQEGGDGVEIAAIEVKGNFIFDPAKHPDFLGAILGTGKLQ